jgi:hypothetical protein
VDWKAILISASISIIPAIISAIVAVKISSRQVYQKWWDKKNEAYSNISEDLSRLLFCIEEIYSDSIGEKQLNDHRIETLNNEFRRRLESFKMLLAGENFVVSKEILEEIKKLIEELDNNHYKQEEEPLWEYIERDCAAIKKFKDKFNELAKKELKIKKEKGD